MADLNDPRKQKKARDRERREISYARDNVRQVMSTVAGRAFMYDLIFHRLGVQDVYPGADSGIYRHEGMRSVGVKLGQELQDDHAEFYILMITERLERQRLIAANRDAATTDEPENE